MSPAEHPGSSLPPDAEPDLATLYGQLQVMARQRMASERDGHTLQPTELVNEALMKVMSSEALEGMTRSRLVGYAARAMRQILTDHARRAGSLKRGGDWQRVTLCGLVHDREGEEVSLLTLDAALSWLEGEDERLARITELFYFGGLSREEIAEELGLSVSMVKRELKLARAMLLRQIDRIEAERL